MWPPNSLSGDRFGRSMTPVFVERPSPPFF
jgi:hypothetical protein